MQLRSLIQLTAGVGAISLADRAIAVGLGIVFARWLGPSEFGAYAFVMTAIALLSLPAKLGVPELLTRDIAASRDSANSIDISRSISKAYVLVGCASFAIVALGQVVLQFTADTEISRLMKFGLWLIIPAAFFDVTVYIVRGFGRTVAFHLYGSLLLTGATLSIGTASMLALRIYTGQIAVETRFAALTLLLMIAGTHLWLILRKRDRALIADRSRVLSTKNILSTGSTFMLNSLINMAIMRIDLLILGIIANEEAVGLYRIAAEGGLLVAFGYATVTTVLATEYARMHFAGERDQLQKTVSHAAWLIMLAGSAIALPLILGSHQIVVLVFGSSYAGASTALAIISAGHFISFIFGDPIFLLNMTGHQSKITLLVTLSVIVLVACCLLLIPAYGIAGAGLASSIALITYRFLAYRAVRQALGINCSIFGSTPFSQAYDKI